MQKRSCTKFRPFYATLNLNKNTALGAATQLDYYLNFKQDEALDQETIWQSIGFIIIASNAASEDRISCLVQP